MSWTTSLGIAAAAALALAPATRAEESKESSTTSAPSSAGGQTSAGAQASADAKGMSHHDNTDVIPNLYKESVGEIELAKVARKNAQSQGVKDFAKQLEKDHGDVKDALAKLAKDRKLKLDDDAARKESQAHVDRLKSSKGAQFDQQFTAMMVSEHEQDLNDVKVALSQARQSGDHELEQVLETAKTKMEGHHRMAMDLQQGKGMEQRQGRRGSERGASDSPATSPSSTGATGTSPQDGGTQSR